MGMVGNRFRTRDYRVHDDTDAPGIDDNWINAQNTPWFQAPGKIFRLRMLTARGSPVAPITTAFRLSYKKDGAPTVRISTISSNIRITPTVHYEHQDDCLDLFLDTGTLLGTPNGQYVDASNATGAPTWPASGRRVESEWSLILVPGDVLAGNIFEFIMALSNGTAFEFSAVNTPTLTVVEPSCAHGVLDSRTLLAGNLKAGPLAQGVLASSPLAQGRLSSVQQLQGVLDTKPQVVGNLKSCGSS